MIAFLILTPAAWGADDNQSAKKLLEKFVAMQRAWGSGMNSAGAALELKEVSRGTANGHTVVKYRMQVFGLPADRIYSLIVWQLGGQPQTNLSGVTIDETGIAICPGTPGTCGDPNKPNDPIDLDMMGGLGETKSLGLITSDQKTKVFASVVPFPNRATDGGCSLEATLVTPNAAAVMLSETGFKLGAGLDVEMTSEGEKQHHTAKANEKGVYEEVILPFKKGLTKGRARVSVRSGNCNPIVSFAWGTGSYVLQ